MNAETDTIDRLDEDEFPWDQVDEMDAIDEGFAAACCGSIPCRNPEGCPR